MERETTPFQSAKDQKRPYVRLVIDTRHMKGVGVQEAGGCVVRHAGKVEFEGAVGAEQLAAAQALMRSMVDGEK